MTPQQAEEGILWGYCIVLLFSYQLRVQETEDWRVQKSREIN